MDGCHSVCDRNYPAVRTDVTDAVTCKRIAFTYSTAQKKLKYLQCCTLVVRSRYDVGALLICFEYAPLLRVWFIAACSYLLAVFFACARSGAARRAYLFHTCQLLRVIVVIFSADHLCVKTFLRHQTVSVSKTRSSKMSQRSVLCAHNTYA